jgi:hypothetical protein
MTKSNITAYVNSLFTFSSRLITSNFSSVLIVFHQFFTWIALDDIPLWFSFLLVRRAKAVEEKIICAVLFYSVIHVTDGMTVMSLSASLLQKISVTMDCLCQIMLNSKLSHQF